MNPWFREELTTWLWLHWDLSPDLGRVRGIRPLEVHYGMKYGALHPACQRGLISPVLLAPGLHCCLEHAPNANAYRPQASFPLPVHLAGGWYSAYAASCLSLGECARSKLAWRLTLICPPVSWAAGGSWLLSLRSEFLQAKRGRSSELGPSERLVVRWSRLYSWESDWLVREMGVGKHDLKMDGWQNR